MQSQQHLKFSYDGVTATFRNSWEPSSTSTREGHVEGTGDQMIEEHGGLVIPQGTSAWDTSAPPASTGSGLVGEAGDQMTGNMGD